MILEKLKLKQSYNTEPIKKLDKQTDKSKTLKRNLRYLRFYAWVCQNVLKEGKISSRSRICFEGRNS